MTPPPAIFCTVRRSHWLPSSPPSADNFFTAANPCASPTLAAFFEATSYANDLPCWYSLKATHLFTPPPWDQPAADALLLLATAYRTVYGIAGSYVTARLAPDRPMQHALAGGAIGLVLSIVGAVATWNAGPAFGPHWYPVALIVSALPCAWAGGKLRVM